MRVDDKTLAEVFDEWIRRYSVQPKEFEANILDADGKPLSDFGVRCASYFKTILCEITTKKGEAK